MQFRREGIHHAHRRRGFFITFVAAVIAVGSGYKLIMYIHFHGAVAQPGLNGPIVDGPIGLHVRIEAAGGVDFVANQCASNPKLVAEVVVITMATVLALVVIEPCNQGQIPRNAVHRLQPAQAAAIKFTVELDNAAPLFICRVWFWRVTYRFWNRQILNHAARTGVRIDLQGRVAKVALVVHAQLLMIDAFARVVRECVGRD